MNLFGGKFCVTNDNRQCNCDQISAGICSCKRKNFDSLLWAIVTVFQVRLYRMLHTVSIVNFYRVHLNDCCKYSRKHQNIKEYVRQTAPLLSTVS